MELFLCPRHSIELCAVTVGRKEKPPENKSTEFVTGKNELLVHRPPPFLRQTDETVGFAVGINEHLVSTHPHPHQMNGSCGRSNSSRQACLLPILHVVNTVAGVRCPPPSLTSWILQSFDRSVLPNECREMFAIL